MPIKTKRLLKLADYLETVPKARFNMYTFGYTDECGFAGCALGWAAHGKLFPDFERATGEGRGFRLHGKRIDGFDAAEKLFSISEDASNCLFTAAVEDETPKQVSKRIRKFVRDHSQAAS